MHGFFFLYQFWLFFFWRLLLACSLKIVTAYLCNKKETGTFIFIFATEGERVCTWGWAVYWNVSHDLIAALLQFCRVLRDHGGRMPLSSQHASSLTLQCKAASTASTSELSVCRPLLISLRVLSESQESGCSKCLTVLIKFSISSLLHMKEVERWLIWKGTFRK